MRFPRTAAAAAVAALALGALPAAGAPAAATPAVADDYPAALAAARARGVPILVDVWAPW